MSRHLHVTGSSLNAFQLTGVQLGLAVIIGMLGQALLRSYISALSRPSSTPSMPTASPAAIGKPLVGVIMGSKSDLTVMQPAIDLLTELGVPFEAKVVSAHRTPDWMFEYASTAESRGLEVIIAAAGGAAHLPGMVAAKTMLPVLGVPVPATMLNGVDSLLSIVQMPQGRSGRNARHRRARRDERGVARGVDRRRTAAPSFASDCAPGAQARTDDVLADTDIASRALMATIAPGSTIGILGGGQLGRMTAMAARTMGYHVHVLDPDADCAARAGRRSRRRGEVR